MIELNQTEIQIVYGAEKISIADHCFLTTSFGSYDYAECYLYPKDLFIDPETKIYYDSYGNFVSNTIVSEKLAFKDREWALVGKSFRLGVVLGVSLFGMYACSLYLSF